MLYTKADCPLCAGLQEKVAGLLARAAFMPSALSSYQLEVRLMPGDMGGGLHMQWAQGTAAAAAASALRAEAPLRGEASQQGKAAAAAWRCYVLLA